MSHNPYAPPQARVVARAVVNDDASAIRREGNTVVLAPNAELPPRCVRCNADAAEPIKQRTLYWHTPWLYVLVIISPLIYLIAALIARKSVKLHPGLCTEHGTLRRNVILGSWIAALIGIVLIVIGIGQSSGPAALAGIALLLIGIFVGLIKGRIVYAAHIDAHRIEIKGCSEPFLASLPRRR